MYFKPKEHNPPHVHVIYQDTSFSVAIDDLSIIYGDENPPSRAYSMVKEWITIHKDELLNMWNTQEIHELEPLN